MCGIIGYVGKRQALPVLLQGLHAQEYRGYDSAGIATLEDDQIRLIRCQGKIACLEEKINNDMGNSDIGIGHTRWATHGCPSEANCHPHLDCSGDIAVVHNGIIENYLELRQWLMDEGHVFSSQTDTEVLPHLLEQYYRGDMQEAFVKAMSKLRGSYAAVALCRQHPRTLVAARQDNPLVVGIGDGEYFLASDIAALIKYTRDMIILENGDVAVINDNGVIIYHDGNPVERAIVYIDWEKEAAEKGGYPHFMLKEIHEQPWAISQTLRGRISDDGKKVMLPEIDCSAEYLKSLEKIAIVACGTAYHAGLVAKYTMEKLLRLPVEVDIASEYRYRNPLVDSKTLVIVISQSGETADTLAALRESKARGARVIAICNVLDSSIAREADHVIYTWAGPEIAVASTKAYLTQLMVIYLLTLHMAEQMQCLSAERIAELIASLQQLTPLAQQLIEQWEEPIKGFAKYISNWQDAFFIGRGVDYAVALEGALKLKEISYIHAEAYAAGELKHGTIALIEPDIPVIALATQRSLIEKTISNIVELRSRGAHILTLSYSDVAAAGLVADQKITLPDVDDLLAPILTVIPLQLLAYYVAVDRGCDVDQPRNLAKSVTVE